MAQPWPHTEPTGELREELELQGQAFQRCIEQARRNVVTVIDEVELVSIDATGAPMWHVTRSHTE